MPIYDLICHFISVSLFNVTLVKQDSNLKKVYQKASI